MEDIIIYQTVAVRVTAYIRNLLVQNTLYIDDWFVASRGSDRQDEELAFYGRIIDEVGMHAVSK